MDFKETYSESRHYLMFLMLCTVLLLLIFSSLPVSASDSIKAQQSSKNQTISFSPNVELYLGSGFPWATNFMITGSPVSWFFVRLETANGLVSGDISGDIGGLNLSCGFQSLLSEYAVYRFGFGCGIVTASDSTPTVRGSVQDNSSAVAFDPKIYTGTNIFFTKNRTIGCGIYAFISPGLIETAIPFGGIQIGLSCSLPPHTNFPSKP